MSTEFGPGKYRMANGEQAIVVCDVGENPIGPSDPYPLKGYVKDGGCSWDRSGMQYGPNSRSPCDLLEPWTDPPTTLEVCERLLVYCDDYSPIHSELELIAKSAKAAIAAEKAKS